MQTSKVTSIEPVGLKKVFDLEVAGHHNYIANGILVHNCSYHDLLDFYGKKYNDEFYKVKDTFITYKHRRLLFYPAGPNKKTLRGRCLVGSTLVNTEYGFLRLDEIVQHDGQISVDFVVDSHNGRQQVSHTYRDIANQTYRITTTNGFTLQGTPEHPMYILTPNGNYQWVKMEDLRPGMAIMSMGDTQSPMWSDISEMSDSSIDILVANAHALGNYPLEMRCSSKRANQTYIDNLIAKYGDFKDDAVHLNLPKDLKHSLQVILVHGFGVVSKNREKLTLAYDQLALLNAPLSHALAGDRLPVQVADNSLHHEIVQTVVLVVDTTEIFDLTVPQGHAFMANGMVSHNTRVLCIAKGTLVNVSRGLVPIEDVVGGDVTYKGNSARKVLSGTFSGNQVVSTITLENGLQIRATKDHLFRVIETGTLQESWVKAVNLKPSMHMLVTLGGDFPEEGNEHVYQNLDGHKYILNSEMARLIAHLSKKTIQGKIKYSEETAVLVAKMFDSPTKDGDNLILSPTASSVLEAFGYAGNNTGVPDKILTSPQAVARSFLLECFGSNLTYTLPIQYVQRVRSLLLKFGILAHSFHSEIRLTTYEYGLLTGNAPGKVSDKDCSAYAIPYSLHAFRKTYIKSELNDQFLVYESEKNRHKDRIDAGLAYCRVHSFYSDWDIVPTYDISVGNLDKTFTANGFVVHNSAIDEIGWFDNQNDGKVKMDATQVYVALDRSLLTVRAAARRLVSQGFDDIPNGFAFNVSSPSSARDKIVELVAQSRSSKKIFGFKRATWEMNPNITKEDLSEEYAKNPVDAERDYACNPPLSDNAFIPSFSSIEGCFIGKPNKVRYKFAQKTMKDGTVTRYAILDDISKSTKKNVLALDAGYCVVGDTLIPTNKGLRRIDSLAQLPEGAEEGYSSGVKLMAGGRYQAAPVARWHYMGVKPTIRITTDSGHSLAGTGNHPQLILRGADHVWVKLSDLKVGDIACFNPTQSLRQKPLKLRLTKPARTTAANNTSGVHGVYKSGNRWSVILYLNGIRTNVGTYATFDEAVTVRNKTAKTYNLDSGNTSQIKIKVPTHMTESLAYFIGALISEGSFKKYRTEFSNTNKAYREKVESCVEEVFGLLPVKTKTLKGAAYCINGREGHTNKSCQSLIWSSKSLCDILRQLGVVESTHGHKTSYHKVIPDCILQADANSQLAFMAAYIEGDGQVYKDRHHIAVWSKSDELLKKFQILLNSHGVMSYIRKDSLNSASAHDAVKLFNLISPYLQHKKHKLYLKRSGKVSNNYGVDASFLYSFFASRFVKRNNAGLTFRTDAGGEFAVKGLYKSLNKQLSYEKYKSGGYSLMLYALEHISKEMKDKVEKLLNLEYSYSEIVNIQSGGKEKVYDLTMEDGYEPAFIANGMVIHNTNNSFGAVCGHLHEGLPILSCFMEVIPNPGIPLNHALIFREAIHEIIRQRNVVLLLADRWQSIKLLQDAELEFENLLAAQYSLRYDDFWIQKQMLFDSEIIFPKLRRPIDDILKFDQSKYPYCFTDPTEHFALQCITVRDMGNSIDKGDGLTDDLFRAASLTTWGLTCDKYQDLFDGDFGEEESMFTGAIGYMAGRSSGVTSTSKEVHVSKGKAIGYMSSKR